MALQERPKSERSGRRRSLIAELRSIDLWRGVLGEFIASILFIVLACGVNFEWKTPTNTHIALSTGLGVATIAHMFWDISGGQFNPAVSIAMLLAGNISPIRCLCYIVSQVLGSAAGGGLMYGLTTKKMYTKFAVLYLGSGVTKVEGFFMEFVLTFILIFTIMSAIEPESKVSRYNAPLAIGISVGVDLFIGMPYTGAGMNPIRAFGPAVVENYWENHWIYWIAPITSSIFTVYMYRWLKGPNRDKSDTQQFTTKTENVTVAYIVDEKK